MTYYANSQHQFQTQFRETDGHIVKVEGAAAKVSEQCGAAIVFGKPEYVGLKVTIKSRTSGQEMYASFKPWRVNGRPGSVAVFHLLKPGNYILSSAIYLRGYQDVTITVNWAEPAYWTN